MSRLYQAVRTVFYAHSVPGTRHWGRFFVFSLFGMIIEFCLCGKKSQCKPQFRTANSVVRTHYECCCNVVVLFYSGSCILIIGYCCCRYDTAAAYCCCLLLRHSCLMQLQSTYHTYGLCPQGVDYSMRQVNEARPRRVMSYVPR